jgi:hypothetical protein
VPDDGVVTIQVSEYEQLRTEINNRTTLAYGLIALQLAALGAGASLINKFPDVLIALAGVSCFLWYFWVDHAGQVYKIAGYLGVVLSPQLRANLGSDVLGWEAFVRHIESADSSGQTLFGSAGKRAFIQRATSADWYTALLFGCSPPGLAVAYVVTLRHLNHGYPTHMWVEVILVGLLWLLGVWRFVMFKLTVKNIGNAILQAAGG